ncbi:hypothetical protein K0G48_21460 [Phocaeicola vulgatus]|uniref:hypothetical protein n=1 Tax=Phocaeicola vulgatus TaxID=821 RepID=UPI001F39BC88|nr:hypothetical protein [Phocaeicola vulgatus]MCE9180916.1 hypothetical protein [Phocaeicola vulgatus]
MPPLLPDEATKAQETFRLGDRFYVEEHGLVLGGLLPTNGIKRTEYYETIRVGASFSIGAPTNEFVYVSHNDGEMMVYIDSTGIVTKIFSSADEIISISLKDNQIMITAIHYDLIVTISVLSF